MGIGNVTGPAHHRDDRNVPRYPADRCHRLGAAASPHEDVGYHEADGLFAQMPQTFRAMRRQRDLWPSICNMVFRVSRMSGSAAITRMRAKIVLSDL